MSNLTKEQIKQYIADTIRLQVEKDPTFASGPGWKKVCKLYGLHELMDERRHQFVTVCLPNNYCLNKLKSNLTNNTHKWLRGAIARVENYSASGENLHLHILVDGVYNKHKIIRDLSRKWKVAKNFVNVQRGTEPEDYNNRMAYIQGNKVDVEKQSYVEQDRLWREIKGIQEQYIL